MHFIRLPFSFEVTAIAPFVFAEATDIVFLELPNVARAVLPAKRALSMFCSIYVRAFVASLVWPSLHAVPVLLVIFPGAFVDGTIVVDILADAISFVVAPLALVNVAIAVD